MAPSYDHRRHRNNNRRTNNRTNKLPHHRHHSLQQSSYYSALPARYALATPLARGVAAPREFFDHSDNCFYYVVRADDLNPSAWWRCRRAHNYRRPSAPPPPPPAASRTLSSFVRPPPPPPVTRPIWDAYDNNRVAAPNHVVPSPLGPIGPPPPSSAPQQQQQQLTSSAYAQYYDLPPQVRSESALYTSR